MSRDSAPSGLLRWLLPAAAIAAAGVAAFAIVERLALDSRAAERRALIERAERLDSSALSPGSALACLDGGAGEATETACEAAVFATPQSTAAAVAYTAARLALLTDAQAHEPALAHSFAATRRALALDRYGIAAHVLAARDGCTPANCPAFALVDNADALKANMKAQAYDQYVSRHAGRWNAAPDAAAPAVSQAPAPAETAAKSDAKTAEPATGELVAHPLSSKYTLPSAASIPAVSIMNAEPALPKAAAEAQAQGQATQPNGA